MSLLPLCLLLAPPPAAAQPFTPGSYVAAVLGASPEVRQASESLLAARHRWWSQLGSAALPSLSFSGTAVPYGHVAGDGYRFNRWKLGRGDRDYTTSATLNVFNSFHDALAVRSAARTRDAASHGLDAARQTRAFEAIKAFHALRLQRELLTVAEQNLKAQEAQYRLTEDLYRHGMKSLTDLLKSETDWRSSELRLADAHAAGQQALLEFNLLLERAPDAAAELEAAEPPSESHLPDAAADSLRAAQMRPEVLRTRAELEKASTALQQSVQEGLPSFAVNAVWNRQDRPSAGTPNPNYQLTMTLALPSGFNIFSQTRNSLAAAAERRRADAALTAAVRQTRLETFQALIALRRAAASYRAAREKARIAERNLNLVTQQYRQGSADVIRLGQAQLDFLQSRVERARAQNDISVGRAQYRLAIGEQLWK